MKTRVRIARYKDIFHIEDLIQEVIEDPDHLQLPPIERPHIYNFLNFHIPRGEIFVAVCDDKLAGFGALAGHTVAWNEHWVMYFATFIIRKPFREVGVQAALLGEMWQHAARNRSVMVFTTPPGIPSNITAAELEKMGAIVDAGSAMFLPSRMEKVSE